MKYQGKYGFFDAREIKTYPLNTRCNKVKQGDLLLPKEVMAGCEQLPAELLEQIGQVAQAVRQARSRQRAVILFTGAHLIKNGMGPLLADLVERRILTLVAGNGATAIHDFELALIGETSENVPNALPQGNFGMAFEFAWLNTALHVGNARQLGFGESLGRVMHDPDFCHEVEAACFPQPSATERKLAFRFSQLSALARAYACCIPMTIHTGIGTDVIDQHPSFDGAAKGGTSGRDFLIFANAVRNLSEGVVINIGSAVTGPEVLLKALSMAANVGCPAHGLTTADFDIRPGCPEHMGKEDRFGYYFRDQKSVVSRIPEAFDGQGYYIQGDQRQTFPALYRALRILSD